MLFFLADLMRNDPQRANNTRNIAMRRDALVKENTDEELVTGVNNSTQAEWQQYPSYYHAIIAEMQRRQLLPRSRKE